MPTRVVLVVEDDPNDEHLTLRALRQAGVYCSVVVAHNAQEALDFLSRSGTFAGRDTPDPSAIFLDNTLPGFAGADLVSEIRKNPALAGVPLIVLSGSSDMNVVDRCSKAGANSYLEKPVEMSDYMKHVGTAAKYWLNLNLSPKVFGARATLL